MNTRSVVSLCAALSAAAGLAPSAAAGPFASSVVDYTPGSNPGAGFTDPSTALGEPTRVTSPGSPFGGAVTGFQTPFGADEVVSIGEGGSLTVAFDEPVTDDAANPFGIDLLVFGNAFYFDTDFPNGVAGGIGSEGGVISVSADGVNFVTVPGVDADGRFPTMGFRDPSAPFTTDTGGPATGTIPSDFRKPVDPSFDPIGKTLAEIVAGYNGSGGGAGVDIGALGLSEISFVRIENPAGSGVTPEIDGFADVPAPGAAGALGLGGLALLRRRRAG